MIAEFPTFTPVSPSIMQDIVELAPEVQHYADFSPFALWCWNRGYPGGVSQLYGNLVIRWKDPTLGQPYLSFAAQDGFLETATMLIDYANRHNLSPCLRGIPSPCQEVCDAIEGKFRVNDDRDNFEYLLSVDEWTRLHGAKFRNMRNTINKLERRLAPSIRLLSLEDEETRTSISRLCNRWAEQRGMTRLQFRPEQTAIQNLFDHIPVERMFVVGVYVHDKLVGFSINECSDAGVGIGHFAKADYAHPGLYTYMLHHVCAYLHDKGVELLNIEQDLGIPGLREAKLLLRPVELLEKVMISARSRPRTTTHPLTRQSAPLPVAATSY